MLILSSLGMGHASSVRTRDDLRIGSGWEPSSRLLLVGSTYVTL